MSAHADGQGRDPRGPPAVRRDRRAPDPASGAPTQLFLESDLVLAVGARFGDRHTGDLDVYRGDRKFIHVDIEPHPDRARLRARSRRGRRRQARARRAAAEAARDTRRRATPGRGSSGSTSCARRCSRRTDFDDVPIKPPRVFREINEFFDADTTFVTAIGLYQIWSGQFQHTYMPRHYLCCGQAGPLGWEVPAASASSSAAPEQAGRGRRRRLLLPVPDGGGRGRRPVRASRSCWSWSTTRTWG